MAKKSKKAPAKKAAPAKKKAAKPAKSQKKTGKASAKTGDKTAADVAAFVGVKIQKPLDPEKTRGFRKALPGYMPMLEDVAKALKKESVDLGIGDVTPAALADAHDELERLHAIEDVLQPVYRSVYEERLALDDKAIGMLHKITRRVGALSEDEPTLLNRWRFLRDFLAHFHGGGRQAQADEGKPETPTDETPAEG